MISWKPYNKIFKIFCTAAGVRAIKSTAFECNDPCKRLWFWILFQRLIPKTFNAWSLLLSRGINCALGLIQTTFIDFNRLALISKEGFLLVYIRLRELIPQGAVHWQQQINSCANCTLNPTVARLKYQLVYHYILNSPQRLPNFYLKSYCLSTILVPRQTLLFFSWVQHILKMVKTFI